MRRKVFFIGFDDDFLDYDDYDSDMGFDMLDDSMDNYDSDLDLDEDYEDYYEGEQFYGEDFYDETDYDEDDGYSETKKDIWGKMDWDKD
jgi:hypothetical protein